MTPWFFLSYKRLPSFDRYVERFYNDLSAVLASRAGPPPEGGEMGFLDRSSIETGDHWESKLTGGLNQSRTLVCLFTAPYLGSPFCGKEFGFFQLRLRNWKEDNPAAGDPPPVILPVLWEDPTTYAATLPPSLLGIQYMHPQLGDQYASMGLLHLMMQSRHRDHYREFLRRFAARIQAAASMQPPPPALENPPAFSEMASAFYTSEGAPVAPPPRPALHGGPREARFIFVAGRKSDFGDQVPRQELSCYGEDDGREWRPFLPKENRIGVFSQLITAQAGVDFHYVQLDGSLDHRLREAADANAVVVIVVDAWSLHVDSYFNLMRAFDSVTFLNSVVLVLWNDGDPETQAYHQGLRDRLHYTFQFRSFLRDPGFFVDPVKSAEDFERVLPEVVRRVQTRLMEFAAVKNRIGGGPPKPFPTLNVPQPTNT